MEHNWFFPPHDGIRLDDLAGQIGATLEDQTTADRIIRSVSPVYQGARGRYMLHVVAAAIAPNWIPARLQRSFATRRLRPSYPLIFQFC